MCSAHAKSEQAMRSDALTQRCQAKVQTSPPPDGNSLFRQLGVCKFDHFVGAEVIIDPWTTLDLVSYFALWISGPERERKLQCCPGNACMHCSLNPALQPDRLRTLSGNMYLIMGLSIRYVANHWSLTTMNSVCLHTRVHPATCEHPRRSTLAFETQACKLG